VQGDLTFAAISLGDFHTCALTPTGKAYCWGSNSYSALGATTSGVSVPQPVAVEGNLAFEQIAAGVGLTCAVAPQGKTYCWGESNSLGTGTSKETKPKELTGVAFKTIAATDTVCAVTATGQGFCWGSGTNGKAGLATTGAIATPTELTGQTFALIVPGIRTSGGITTAGKLLTFGSNEVGMLGQGVAPDSNAHATPTEVAGSLTFKTP
jgi:alpha-tubulin suppressor-like RCC1 family protein